MAPQMMSGVWGVLCKEVIIITMACLNSLQVDFLYPVSLFFFLINIPLKMFLRHHNHYYLIITLYEGLHGFPVASSHRKKVL